MPIWEVHRKIYKMFGISEEISRNIDSLVDNLGDIESLLGKIDDKELIEIFRAYQEMLSNNLHDAPLKYPEALYIYLCLAYKLHGEDGVKALYLHYIIDYLNPFANWALMKEHMMRRRIAMAEDFMKRMLNKIYKQNC